MANRKEYEMLFQLNAQLGGSYNSTFKSAQTSIVSMQKEIEALSKTQSDISAYQKQQSAVEATQKKLEVLKQQYDNIQREMSETGQYSSDLENKLLAKQQQIDKTTSSIDTQNTKLKQMGNALREAGVDTDALARESAKLGSQIDVVKQKQEDAADKANNFGATASAAFSAVEQAIVAAGIAASLKEIYEFFMSTTDASVEFESAMTGVAKTTDFTNEELAAMAANVKEMSTDIPATTTELDAIAETAGQLGIEKDSLLSFTDIMAMLGTATNMTSEEAATMLAQFASITGMDPSFYSNLGSTIVALGNNYATTERNIANMSQTIAAAGSIAGMSEADITAIAGAVTSLGISAENGGTQTTKLISDINSAVSSGEDLDKWARAAGSDADTFAKAWGDNAAGALDTFIHGLHEAYVSGQDVYGILADLGITETRMVTMITSLAKSGTRLTDTLNTANVAWDENTALTAEAEKRYSTTQSELILMQNGYNNLKIAVGDNYTPALRELYEVGAEVLGEMTEFVEKHPALVKAATAFVVVLGTVVAGLAAYAVGAKVAAAASALLTASIPGVNIIMGITLGVAALTAGVVALSEADEETIPTVKELTEAARSMGAAMREATETYDDTVTSTLATASVADTYIGKLEELNAAGIKTDEQSRQYHNTLALLCQVVPDLADYIDLETDKINGGTEALRANTEAWKNNAMQQAYQKQYNAIYESYSDVLVEAEKNSIQLTKAQYKLEEANRAHSSAIAEMNRLWSEAQQRADAFSKETGNSADATMYLSKEYYELQESLGGLSDDVWDAEQAVKAHEKAIAKDNEAAAEAKEQIELTDQAIQKLTSTTEDEVQAAKEAAAQQKELQIFISDTTEEAKKLAEAYTEAYKAALDSVDGQYSLWDKAASVAATSASKINAALESQVNYWQDYNANLAGLTDRSADIEGLGDMIASFADGSAESVNAVAGMAKASDEDLAAMVKNWQTLQAEQKTTADKLAELETDFTASMDALQQELESTVAKMKLGEEAAKSGKDTIQGFIDGAEKMLDPVKAAYAKIAKAAVDAIDKELEINSPSKVLWDRGKYAIGGFVGGVEAMEPEVTQVMAETAGASTEAFSAEEARFAANASRFIPSASAQDAVVAQLGGNGDSVVQLSLAPQYNISGASNTAEVEAMLRDRDSNLKELILELIENAGIEVKRRVYA